MDAEGLTCRLLLVVLTLGVLAGSGQAQGDRPCPATDPQCECVYDSHDIITAIRCDGLGRRDSLPVFNASDDIIPTLIVSNSTIYKLQAGAFSGLKIRNLLLNSLRLSVIEQNAFQGLEEYLESLEMKDNIFVTLPEFFLFNFVSLNTLALDRNRLDRVMPNWFLRMSQLQYMSLAGNQIRGIHVDSFSSLLALKVLYLTANKLTRLDGRVFSKLDNLKELGLGSNNLTTLPTELLNSLTSLRWLELSRNELEDLPDGLFGQTQSLVEVSVSSNKIREIRSTIVPTARTLEILVFSNNNITILRDSALSNVANLRKLALDHNSIEVLPDLFFEALHELEVLHLQNNIIKELPQNILTGLLKLEELDLQNNNIKTLTYGVFDPLGSLTYLDISWNSINEVHFGPFDALRKMTFLDLSNNQLPKIEANWFRKAESLKELYLFHNVIRSVEEKSFSKMPVLEKLLLNYNYIQEVDLKMFAANKELRVLSLSHNPLKVVPTGSFGSLHKLESLHLNYTCLSDLPNGFFANLSTVRELYLDHLPLEAIRSASFMPLSSVRTLILGYYNISTIEPRPFFSVNNLTNFAADHMGLTVDSLANILVDLPEATRISVKYNSLNLPQRDTFFANTQLKELSLVGNPLVCGCALAWLRTYAPLVDIESTGCGSSSNDLAACYQLPDNCPSVLPLPTTKQSCESVGSTLQSQGDLPLLDYSHCIVPPEPTTPRPTTPTPPTIIAPITLSVYANKTQVMVVWQQSQNPNILGYRVRYRQFATNISKNSPDLGVNTTVYHIQDLVSGQNYFVCVDIKFPNGYLRNELGCKEIGINLITTTTVPRNDSGNSTGTVPSSEQVNPKSLLVIVGASAAAFVVIFLIIVIIVCFLRKTKTRFAENAKKKEERDKMVKDKMGNWVNSFNYDGNVNESMAEQLMLDFDLFSGSNPTVSKARQAQLLASMGRKDPESGPPPEVITGDVGHHITPPMYDDQKVPTTEVVNEEEFPGDVSGSDPGYGESEAGYDNTNSDSGHGDSTRPDVIF